MTQFLGFMVLGCWCLDEVVLGRVGFFIAILRDTAGSETWTGVGGVEVSRGIFGEDNLKRAGDLQLEAQKIN